MEIKKVLVPIDFSGCSEAAVDYAAFLACELGAHIDVLHVWSPPRELGRLVTDLAVTDPLGRRRTLSEVIRTDAGSQLKEVLQQLENDGANNARGRLAEGTPHRVIVDVAADGDYDLVVMGTHGRTGLSRTILGSVAERVVRQSLVPVLTVRSANGSAGSSSPPADGG